MILKDITPPTLQCKTCKPCCPALFETEQGDYMLIGSLEDAQKLGIADRVGEGEVVIRVPRALLQK
jgi:hypothetical protein